MANEYGYFRYDDIVVGAKESATFSTSTELQPGSTVESLKTGVVPYDFASLETDTYYTDTPKRFADDRPLGFVSATVSDENGNFAEPPGFAIKFEDEQMVTTYGITIYSENILHIRVRLLIWDGSYSKFVFHTFHATQKNEFFSWDAVKTLSIRVLVESIDKPGAFLRIYNVDFGRSIRFEENNILSAQVHTTFPLTGESIEYDTLDLQVLYDSTHGYFFQRRQPIVFFGADGTQRQTFYVHQGETVETASGLQTAYTAKISAYDVIESMEDTFLGGMYEKVPVKTLLADIMGNIPYTVQGADGITLTGHIPITTRRKALALVCRGCNLRVYRGASIVIQPLEKTGDSIYNRQNIVDAPTVDVRSEIVTLTLQEHNYSKGTEEKELYHWYISKTYPVTITWSDPVHTLKAYEVTGVDENGNDIVSETESTAITFDKVNANYCIVTNTSDNKIVLRGQLYVDSTVDHTSSESQSQAYDSVSTVTIYDQTILSDASAVLNMLYSIYTRSATVTSQCPDVPNAIGQKQSAPYAGQCADVLGSMRTVTSVNDTLCGLYDMEAT